MTSTIREILVEAQQRFGRERVVLALQRTAEDFFLPSPTGSGRPLTQKQLHQLMEERSPSVFFSRELCARYFTYMSRDSGAHFVLFDDAQTMAKKVEIARQLSIPTILGAWSDLQDAVPLWDCPLLSPAVPRFFVDEPSPYLYNKAI